jgi:hypothetical protein
MFIAVHLHIHYIPRYGPFHKANFFVCAAYGPTLIGHIGNHKSLNSLQGWFLPSLFHRLLNTKRVLP